MVYDHYLIKDFKHCMTRTTTNQYTHGGLLPIDSVNILRLISELEGSYQLLKYHAFDDDMNTLDEMKKRYYKLYFKTKKEERLKQQDTSQ